MSKMTKKVKVGDHVKIIAPPTSTKYSGQIGIVRRIVPNEKFGIEVVFRGVEHAVPFMSREVMRVA